MYCRYALGIMDGVRLAAPLAVLRLLKCNHISGLSRLPAAAVQRCALLCCSATISFQPDSSTYLTCRPTGHG